MSELQKQKARISAAVARAAKAAKAPSLEERFWSKVDRRGEDECWPWLAAPRKKTEGYGAFYFNGRQQPATRAAWFLTYGDPGNAQVLHRCDNPPCCNPRHLFLGTNLINNADKVSKGRHCFGAKNGCAKLSEDDALRIKKLKPQGRSPRGYRSRIAQRFGVAPATITDVWSRRWNHLN